jgi:hypothetical protein
MKALLLHVGVAALVALAALAAYDRWIAGPARRIGVVDVGEVYRLKEAEFTLSLTRANSEAERETAMRGARLFAQRLPHALEELPRECGCMVVLRTALAAPSSRTVDLTAELRRKVETP